MVPFEKWATGEDLFSNLDKEHDIVDRDLRPFVEEADQMQGIQVMATFDDAWGGFASDYIERLRDEYGKTDIWVWGLQDQLRGHSRVRDTNHKFLQGAALIMNRTSACFGSRTKPRP